MLSRFTNDDRQKDGGSWMNFTRTHGQESRFERCTAFADAMSEPQQTDTRPWRAGDELQGQSEASEPTLLLDVKGHIRFCNAAARALFCRDGESLVGRAVSCVLPALKLTDATPGYNVAYVAFWYPEDRWHAILGIDSHGDPVALEIALHDLRLRDGHTFVATLRRM
jgi:hypothetical protein